MVYYKRYLPLDPESIGERLVDEVVQEIRNILLNKEWIITFNPDLDELLTKEDEPTDNICMIKTRGSNKETKSSRH